MLRRPFVHRFRFNFVHNGVVEVMARGMNYDEVIPKIILAIVINVV